MRRYVVGVGLGLAVGILLVVATVTLFIRGGISARMEPSALEARIARALLIQAIPAKARQAKNPIPRTPDAIAEGLAHFADHCATCHGNDGSGRTETGRKLYPRAPDMRRPETQRLSDGELFYIIENGVRFTGMPAWGGPDTAEDSWELVHFIRHLPMLTPEDAVRMEALNPKTPKEWRELEEEERFLQGEAPAPHEAEHDSHSH